MDYRIILTLEDYFDVINFDEQPPKEQIAYILFYVTKIAKLRKDMIPEVIADRIHDQYKLFLKRTHLKEGEGYNPLTREKVKEIMQKSTDYFEESIYGLIEKSDRKEQDVAYVLTKSKFTELDLEFKKEIKDKIKKVKYTRRIEFVYMGLVCLFIVILLFFTLYGLSGIFIEDRGEAEKFVVVEYSVRGLITLLGGATAIWGLGFGIGKNLLFDK